MMAQSKRRSLGGASLIVIIAIGVVQAGPSSRQYYNEWTFYPQFGYYYSSYYYQPIPGDKDYKHQFCIFYPAHPRYVYYFDPEQHRYWARLEVNGATGHQFSLLAPRDRKEKLKDIPEEAFPKPDKMPAIPGSKDGALMEPIKFLPQVNGSDGKSSPGQKP